MFAMNPVKAVRVKVPLVRPMVRCSFKRVLRTMPSVVLLVFVVGLIFLTLMQIAVIHANRRALYAQRDPVGVSSGSAASTQSVTTTKPSVGPVKPVAVVKTAGRASPDVVRIEAFVDKSSPTVEANMASLQTEINIAKVKNSLTALLANLTVLPLRLRKVTSVNTPVRDSMPKEQKGGHLAVQRTAASLDNRNEVASINDKSNTLMLDLSKETDKRVAGSTTEDDVLDVSTTTGKTVELCPPVPPNLKGRVKVNLSFKVTWEDIHKANPGIQPGGLYQPKQCKARHRVAIIIPYRDREEHLAMLLSHLFPILQRQQLHFKVYVVEQFGNDTFNKGVLMNAGVKEALREDDYHCFVFHDVDMIPEDDRNMYSCPPNPRHLSLGVDKFNYTLPYSMLVGGVFAIKTEHFALVNGYSNLYWGWGGEDDDIAYRISFRKLPIVRPPESVARYTMIKHDHRAESPSNVRSALLRMSKRRSARDGLNSVKYKLVSKIALQSYTHLMIDIGPNHRWKFVQGKKLIISF